jgi:hypothetical protein
MRSLPAEKQDAASMQALQRQIEKKQAADPRFSQIEGHSTDADAGAIQNGHLPVTRDGQVQMYRNIVQRRRQAEANGEPVPQEVRDAEKELMLMIKGAK